MAKPKRKKAAAKAKRTVIMSDLHCGHITGLTSPAYQIAPQCGAKAKAAQVQKKLWEFYAKTVDSLKPIDVLIVNGDCIDGRGERSGGTELVFPDRSDQVGCAAECIRYTGAEKIVMTYGCLTAGHRILTADLRWVPVETLKKGDKVLGFDENPPPGLRRGWQVATVSGNDPVEEEVYRLHLSDGTTLEATGDHPFLMRGATRYWRTVENMYRWMYYRDTNGTHKREDREGKRNTRGPIRFERTLPVWETPESYAAGYISGFFDGEGSCSQRRKERRSGHPEHAFAVCAYQNDNPMLQRATKYLEEFGFKYDVVPHGSACNQVNIRGGTAECLRFLGTMRPPRLLDKFDPNKLGALKTKYVDDTYINSIERIGVQVVYGLGTDTGTYVSEGFLSHNTPYHTGQEEDWEDVLAREIGAKIGAHEWVDINGLVFDVKHHVGSSQIPHGRHTAVARERLWSQLWAEREQTPKADVIIRCLSEDTEILTANGWRSRLGVRVGDRVMTLNRESGKLEWNTVKGYTSQETDREMVHFKAKGYDVLVTPDHSMVYKPMSSENWRVRPARELNDMSMYRLPVSGFYDAPGADVDDATLRLMAWVIAEGSMDVPGDSEEGKCSVRIFQSVSRADHVESMIKSTGIEYTKNVRNDAGRPFKDGDKTYYTKEDTCVFYLRQPHSRQVIRMLNGEKNIPDWLMTMDARQFELFLDEYVIGDGHKVTGCKRKQGTIYTANKDLADRLQILLVCNGYKAQVSPRERRGSTTYDICFVKKQVVHIQRHSYRGPLTSVVPYGGKTWCVSVPNGTLMTRRNGKVAIVGNSHVHYFDYCGGRDWLAMTTPALQGLGTKFGARRCSGTVDFGLLSFDVTSRDEWSWHWHIAELIQRARVTRV